MKIRIEPGSLLALGTTLLLWASAFAGIRAGLSGYSPGHLALLRFIVASLALAIYAVATRMKMPQKGDWPGIALTGWLGISGYNLALNYGETSLTAGVASFMVNTGPIFTALLAMTFLGERLRGWGWLGIAVSFGGVSLIAFAKESGFIADCIMIEPVPSNHSVGSRLGLLPELLGLRLFQGLLPRRPGAGC